MKQDWSNLIPILSIITLVGILCYGVGYTIFRMVQELSR